MMAYKGNVINFEQDIVGLASSLLCRVDKLPIVIVRRKQIGHPW